ncbi:MAG: hypothetical protein JW838_13615 [Spirochaetes bacterium]|nr:hypothetical protein [Spirochaetota bacterium]
MKPQFVSTLILAASVLFTSGCGGNYAEIMAVTGATPLAIKETAPGGITLTVSGMVKREYRFTSKSLNAFAPTRIRTMEVSPGGEFEGAYAYDGVPIFNILEGIEPVKTKDAAFDRPLDMIVTFTSRSGKKSRFSYGELTMTDDRHPVTLAFSRKQVLPSKNPELYTKNIHREPITGLRLICPREPDTGRYLDDVVSITLELLTAPDDLLPVMKKGSKCDAGDLVAVEGGKARKVSFTGISPAGVSRWVRIGHGQGYKGIASASGYDLRSFLEKQFPGAGPDDFYLFVGCDGYRVLFSGRELFLTRDGASCMIATVMDGKKARGNFTLAATDDYFVDRNIWGLSHVVHLRGQQ